MPYTITNRRGNTLVVIPDGSIDSNTTSLSLPGPNFVGYGSYLNQNLIHMLENFAGRDAPGGINTPLEGQLWFDTYYQKLKIYSAQDGYIPVSGVIIASLIPAHPRDGDLWFNTVTNQLSVYSTDLATWELIGPAYTKAQGVSGAIPVQVNDANQAGVTHNILKLQYGSTVIAIVSSDPAFSPAPPIPGFPVITPGITLNTVIPGEEFDGNVLGNILGNLTGTVTGNVTGNLTGNVVGSINGNVVGSITGNVVGNVTGNLTGNVIATKINSAGYFYANGDVYANFSNSNVTAYLAAGIDSTLANINSSIAGANAAIILSYQAATGNAASLNSSMIANITAANAAIVSANTALKGYVDSQVGILNTSITTANSAVVMYVNMLNTAMAANVTAANAAIVTANTAVSGYANVLNAAMTANVTAANAAVVNANAAVKSYVDSQVTILTGNIAAVTTAWTANAGIQEVAIASLRANITAANILIGNINTVTATQGTAIAGLTSNVAFANSAISSLSTTVASISSTVSNISTAVSGINANSASQEAEISSLRANITAANAVIGNVNSTVTNLVANPLRMINLTLTQILALTPLNGDIVFNTTYNKFQGYANGTWGNLTLN